MDLSIIIVSYNTRAITRDCLQSIRDSDIQLNYEIILVDNSSTDGSVEMIEMEFPEVVLIKNTSNNMFAKANNQGMEIARGEYFLLLNSDTIVRAGNIERMFHFISTYDSRIACVGPRMLNSDETIQSEDQSLYSIANAICDVFNPFLSLLPHSVKNYLLPPGHKQADKSSSKRKSGWVSGACMLVSARAAREISGFDDDYFFYGEEVDFCQRLKNAGYEVWINTEAEVIHLNGASSATDRRKKHEKIIRSRAMFCKKHFSRPAMLLYLYIYIVGYKIGYFFKKDKDWKRNCQWGYSFYKQILNRIESSKG